MDLVARREFAEIADSTFWIGDEERRMVAFGSTIEKLVLERLAVRLASKECDGMNREAICQFIERLTYDPNVRSLRELAREAT